MPEQDRLANIVERCRAELHPNLRPDLVSELARIQVQFQFAGDDRAAAQKEMKAALSAALPLANADGTPT
jgi:hypothetical protein